MSYTDLAMDRERERDQDVNRTEKEKDRKIERQRKVMTHFYIHWILREFSLFMFMLSSCCQNKTLLSRCWIKNMHSVVCTRNVWVWPTAEKLHNDEMCQLPILSKYTCMCEYRSKLMLNAIAIAIAIYGIVSIICINFGLFIDRETISGKRWYSHNINTFKYWREIEIIEKKKWEQ